MDPQFPESQPSNHERPPLPALSFEEAWSFGMQGFKANYGLLVGVGFAVLGVSAIDNVVTSMLEQISEIGQAIWMIGMGLLVSIPMSAGMVLVGANVARRGRGTFTDLFLGYRRLGALLGWSLLAGLAGATLVGPAVLLVLALQRTSGNDVAVVVGICVGLVYLVGFIFVGTRLQLVGPMLVDPHLPARPIMATVKAAWGMTSEGKWLSLFVIYLVAGIMMMASILLLCIGLPLVGYPLYIAVTGAAYAMLTEDQWMGVRRCERCGYDLTGLAADACPECGARRDVV
jgi:hypothetical protein